MILVVVNCCRYDRGPQEYAAPISCGQVLNNNSPARSLQPLRLLLRLHLALAAYLPEESR